ncbi:MAG: GTPase Era [Gammaproteobacteria bacterium]|nr:GTPase Era [Gammaproteobacteria bacterium]
MVEKPTRCGYVALVGRPNVGKSTLLNHLLRQKLSITSRRPQTTRHLLLGVDTEGPYQAVYVDTPGIHHHARRQMNRNMVRSATSVLQDVDLVVMLVERDKWTIEDDLVLDHVRRVQVPKFALINKIDLLREKTALLPALGRLEGFHCFEELIPVSALQGTGLETLRGLVFKTLPVTPHLFPADQVTDKSQRFLVAEIVREKLLRRLGEEIPHRVAVEIEEFDEQPDIVDIAANIIVERSGQKRIIIGSKGEKLKSIGKEARLDIERLLERKVMLRLWVKVKPGWTNNNNMLRRMGYE